MAANLRRQGIDKVEGGQHLCLPLKRFASQSPNGTHICFVYPVLGPPAGDAANIFHGQDNTVDILQDVARQAVAALAALHSRGICHGDEERLLSLLKEPKTVDNRIREDSHPTPEIPYAPKYLVFSVDFPGDVDPSAILPRTQVIDFGQSFDISHRPLPAAFGIPTNYAAPEVILDGSGSVAMDLWSLGCTLYEIRLGRRLFNVPQMIRLVEADYVYTLAALLGEPPEPWAEYCVESDDESDAETSSSNSSSENDEDEDACIEPQVERARSIQEKLGSCQDCTWQECAHPQFQLISEAEAATLADLLEKLLRYRPEERLSAQDVLEHPWFHTKY
ncbi:Dual specificity tyrosine-phosphorylation-regulated kinase 1B [Tolypocladium ophioglossoides CBS 100239]|uniref:Dual specificity tyrosine-phosphorylation-regulated kinase 1B n=1 Tax=Tolypocladium ophioglossoides (strain CBS 100239) TaxID=1163406 RepID=A0A0L0MZP6_TOLOC|nr:Dual specificity tyrosine-phosphorylation-regulated kinase 1B [Tolypocladium ophioglossoides CBS 100239]